MTPLDSATALMRVPAVPRDGTTPAPPALRVGLNLLYLIPGVVGGTEAYAVSLIRALAALDSRNEYLMFVSREAAGLPIVDAPNFRRVVCGVHATRRATRYAWEQLLLPWWLRANRAQVVHSLGYVGPLVAPCRHVVTIHDLNYIHHGASMPAAKRRVLGGFVEGAARRADHILTVSEFSRRDIATHLGVPLDRITVTYNAGRSAGPAAGPGTNAVLARYGIRRPYLLAFSSQSAHKNIDGLVRAFARIAASVPHSLVLVGHAPAGATLLANAARAGVGERVVATGYVPDADVMPLLGGAELFVFPSRYEGFGIPVLDAQRAGVAVACSRAGALPEVAGEAAAYFDPDDIDDMAAVVARCLHDPAARADLRARGLRNVDRFSWARTARETLRVYERLGSGHTALS